MNITYKATIEEQAINGTAIFEIDFDASKGSPASWTDPEDPGDLSINEVTLESFKDEDGEVCKLTDKMKANLISWVLEHHSEKIDEACMEAANSDDHYED